MKKEKHICFNSHLIKIILTLVKLIHMLSMAIKNQKIKKIEDYPIKCNYK